MLPDPIIEGVIGHERFDAAIADRAAIIERQFAIDHIGDEVGATHGKAAHRIWFDIILRLEEVIRAREAILEHERIVEHGFGVLQRVENDRRCRASQQQGAARGGVDDAMHGVHRDREHRALLPFKHMLLGLALDPDFGRAAPFHDEVDLLIHVLFGVQRATGWHFNHIAAPLRLGAIELDEMALTARALPRHQGQVLDLGNANATENRDAL